MGGWGDKCSRVVELVTPSGVTWNWRENCSVCRLLHTAGAFVCERWSFGVNRIPHSAWCAQIRASSNVQTRAEYCMRRRDLINLTRSCLASSRRRWMSLPECSRAENWTPHSGHSSIRPRPIPGAVSVCSTRTSSKFDPCAGQNSCFHQDVLL